MPTRITKQSALERQMRDHIKKRVKTTTIIIVVLVLILTLFGPQVGAVFGFFSKYRNVKEEKKSVLPIPPIFTNTKASTNKEEINLQGFAREGTTIKLFVNGPEAASVIADASGSFSFENVKLIKGTNTLFAKSVSANNSESDNSQTLTIKYDDIKTKLEILSPKDGDIIKNLNERIQITGKLDEKATVTINDRSVILKPDFTFEFLLGVNEGELEIKIKVVDEAGNEEEQTLKVTYLKQS